MQTLMRAWQVLCRNPLLALVPVLWETAVYGAAVHWFGVILLPDHTPGLAVRFLLPPSLPEGGQLIDYLPTLHSPVFDGYGLTLIVLLTFASGYIKAGYLNLLRSALQDEPATYYGFTEGASQYGRTLAVWQLIWLACGLAAAYWGWGPLSAALMLALTLLFLLVDFLVVLEELPLLQAIAEAPRRLIDRLRAIAPAVGAALAASALLSLLLSVTGMRVLALASPLWAWFGTLAALALMVPLIPQPEEPSMSEEWEAK